MEKPVKSAVSKGLLFRAATLSISALMLLMTSVVLAACGAQETQMPTVTSAPVKTLSRSQVLILSGISKDPAGQIESFQPLADYLAAHLADFGIKQGEVVIAPDMPTMIHYHKTAQVDLYFDSPYPALTVYQEAGVRPLLRRWNKGIAGYRTIIAVRRDSGITDLNGLLGKVIAFDARASTAGYLLPQGHLTELGYKITEKHSATSVVAADEIGYVFVGGEKNVLAWVLQRKTAGSAISSGDYDEFAADVKSQLLILSRTPNVPREIVLARPGMDEALQARIVELLLGLHKTTEGRSILAKSERTTKFDALPEGPEGTMKMLGELFQRK